MANKYPLGIESNDPGNYWYRPDPKEAKLAEALREDYNINPSLDEDPIVSAYDITNKAFLTGESAAGQEIPFSLEGKSLIQHNAVVESTGTSVYAVPYISADGLELPLDADVTDGVTAAEISTGTLAANCKATVGSFLGDKKFFIDLKIKIDDITDLDQLFVGMRKLEAFQAEPDDYDELAAMHVGETGATVADGQINIATILNNGATSYTDTTETDWADAGEHNLRVEVDNDGACKFFYDGATPAATTSFSFDSGEVIVPFIFYENTSGSTTGDPGITITDMKMGWL